MDVGQASGWNVWRLENGDWAWRAWNGSVGLPRSGVETTAALAQEAAQQALDELGAEDRAMPSRELPAHDNRDEYWNPLGIS
ncbi:MAG: hypothetical protein ACRDMJ_00705 [Solirubrobacteraceae bacterium]